MKAHLLTRRAREAAARETTRRAREAVVSETTPRARGMAVSETTRRGGGVAAAISACLLLAGCTAAAAVANPPSSSTTAAQNQARNQTQNQAQNRLQPFPHRNYLSLHPHKARPKRAHQTKPPSSTVPTTAVPGTAVPGTLPPAGGGVTAIGDSVMLDFEPALQQDIPGIRFDAFVGQQWYQGIEDVQTLRSEGQLGSIVIIELGTNGPVSDSDFAAMMQALSGVSRVVLVTNYVNESWTDWQVSNNEVIESGAAQYHNAVVANWCALAEANPEWFTPNGGPHVAIGGTAAQAAASLIKGYV